MQRRSIAVNWVAVPLALLGLVDVATAGTYVEQTVSSSGGGINTKSRGWVDGDNGKLEFTKSDSEVMPKGSYLLTNDGGETAYLINPKEKTISLWDLDAIFAALGEFTKEAEGVVDIDFKDPEAEELGSEPGGELLGMNTTKRSWRTAYSLEMNVVFMKQNRRMETTTDAWLTDEIDVKALRTIWFAINPPKTGDPDLDLVLTQGISQVDSMPLKVVQRTSMKNKKGRGKTSKTTMEITELREEAIDSSIFAMPEGYTEVPLFDFSGTGDEGGDGDDPLGELGGLFDKEK